MRKLLALSLISTFLISSSVEAFGMFHVDLPEQIKYNEKRIQEYKNAIKKLEKENIYLKKEKQKHPQLYVKKPLFEKLKDKYIFRIKLNGAKTDALNFVIKDDVVSISMNIKNEQKDEGGYFFSSRYFSTAYKIPHDVNQEKIKNSVDGDYFVVEMPKK